jgi:hypothetical protein
MPPVAQAPRRYIIEFGAAMLLYVVAVKGRVYALHYFAEPALRDAILLSPIVPILLGAWAVVRFYRRVDEFHKLRLLETLAISAGVTAVFAICWEFLEDVGAPHLQVIWAWGVMGLSWLVVTAVFGWRDKVSEGKLARSLLYWAATLAIVALVTGAYAAAAFAFGLPHSRGALTLVAIGILFIRVVLVVFSKKHAQC